ncbi:unnamed protein product [Sphagnum balticum]
MATILEQNHMQGHSSRAPPKETRGEYPRVCNAKAPRLQQSIISPLKLCLNFTLGAFQACRSTQCTNGIHSAPMPFQVPLEYPCETSITSVASVHANKFTQFLILDISKGCKMQFSYHPSQLE